MNPSQQTLESYTAPRQDVFDIMQGAPKRVLDIGCSDGAVGSLFCSRGAEVWGIEYVPEFAALASTKLDRVLVGDALEQLKPLVAAGETFDCVICADSLEHMPNPEQVLDLVHEILDPGGQCIVSVPNVRFYSTLTALTLKGRWPMNDRGVHDRTHLRWFTDKNARDMFAGAGFSVTQAVTHYRIADRPRARRNRVAKYLAVPPIRPFLAYQLVYRLTPAP